MATWFIGGMVIFYDNQIHRCDPKVDYLYSNHLYGYCGKQGQSHTQIDFHNFELWQTGLFCLWPSGMIVVALLRKGLPKSEKVG